MKLSLAKCIASGAHAWVTDKGGKPYIEHPLRVMDAVEIYGEDAQVVAILHDVVEDTPITVKMLREWGLTDEQADALERVTRNEDELYFDYIERAKGSFLSLVVKIADLEDNLSLERLGALDPDEAKGLERRYRKSLETLERQGI